jgi:polyhydroxybutyrate depolymerase
MLGPIQIAEQQVSVMSKNDFADKVRSRLFLKISCVAIFIFGCVWRLEAASELTRREWKVDGVTREALVHIPRSAETNAAPVVFAFHGHSGSMRNAANTFHIETLWPEAIVVYMQGLKTPGILTDPDGKQAGWQSTVGDQKNRDLKFFDTVLASLKRNYKVNAKQIYSTGHSNGGSFTYLLWEARPHVFAAFAPSSAVDRNLVDPSSNGTAGKFVPERALHIAGKNDPLVKFTWQMRMIDALRQKNLCGEGKPWDVDKRCTIYKSKVGADLVTYIHPGTHKFPEEAPEIIVKFFQEMR